MRSTQQAAGESKIRREKTDEFLWLLSESREDAIPLSIIAHTFIFVKRTAAQNCKFF